MCEIGAGDAASILTLAPLPTSQTLTSVVAEEWQGSAEIVTDSSQYLAFDAMDTRPDWITGSNSPLTTSLVGGQRLIQDCNIQRAWVVILSY